MRLACMAVTAQGMQLAQNIRHCLDEYVDIYVSEKLVPDEETQRKYQVHVFKDFSEAVERNFKAYEGLIFVMATGIVVRAIAPFLQDKLTDPAVVVFDEQGKHGISLLSGHVGGANELTRQICQALGAGAVTCVPGPRFGLRPLIPVCWRAKKSIGALTGLCRIVCFTSGVWSRKGKLRICV